jgi:hypothetical protein
MINEQGLFCRTCSYRGLMMAGKKLSLGRQSKQNSFFRKKSAMLRKWSCLISVVFVLGLVLSSVANAVHPTPAAWWKLDGDVLDSSGNDHNGTINGNPTFVPGYYDDALEFHGDDYVTITGHKGILGAHAFSISAWVKTTDNGVIVAWGGPRGGYDQGKYVQFRTDDNLLRIEHGGGNVVTNNPVTDGEWHHVAVTVTENSTIQWPDVKL